jgi:hypothetical protein
LVCLSKEKSAEIADFVSLIGFLLCMAIFIAAFFEQDICRGMLFKILKKILCVRFLSRSFFTVILNVD